jgi:hypothetical protein
MSPSSLAPMFLPRHHTIASILKTVSSQYFFDPETVSLETLIGTPQKKKKTETNKPKKKKPLFGSSRENRPFSLTLVKLIFFSVNS